MEIPHYLVPMPSVIATAAWSEIGVVSSAFIVTLTTSLVAFTVSLISGVLVAILLSSSRIIERAVYPYVIVLQAMPSVAIAPLIIIWFGVSPTAVVIIATIMAFFPVLTNTLIGLRSTDKNLQELYKLLNASKFQSLVRLRLPAALPYIVTGIKLCGVMAVVGVIVGEYVSGIGSGNAGLGFLIIRFGIRLEVPEMFAAGLACAFLGIIFNFLVSKLSRLLLGKWHESEMTESS
ncbi:ABC transporter permease [Nesterenkonia ebinurensis]|uniref:ABC transporter permease n=1 Tax=Nesterenkonia ebinurensis TaxID=2608252 RepID=UPI00168B9EC4|nr:ABC transporter permease [Nesterenkonia ebinurensis]